MKPIATLSLVEAGPFKVLAGHDQDDEFVFVLRKSGDVYELHQIPIATAEIALRNFLTPEQAEHGESVKAILQTEQKPIRKPRRKRKRKSK